MDISNLIMYKPLIMKPVRISRTELFRTPLERERTLGLWVDRIGQRKGDTFHFDGFRVLGLYAVVGVERGTGILRTASRGTHSVGAGDAILLFPDEGALYHPDVSWDTRWIVWNGPEASVLERLNELTPANPVIRGGAAAVTTAWNRISPVVTLQDPESLLARKIALLEMIRDLAALNRPAAGLQAPTWLAGAMRGLTQTEGSHESLQSLARRLHVSPAHFRRLFKAHTGTSPKAFQLAQRINKAKELLTAGRSIKDVAETLGFADVFHFMRLFRRITGQTAGQFSRRSQLPVHRKPS